MMLRPLLAYAPWQLREVAVRALSPALIFAVLAFFPLMVASKASGGMGGDPAGQQQLGVEIFRSIGGLSVLIGGLLVMNGSIATDRDKQHLRFLFAHPVSPIAFYVQRFVVATAAIVGVFTVVPVVYSALVVEVPVFGAAQAMLLACVLYGAIAMFAGAVTAKDGALVIGIFLVASVLQQVAVHPNAPDWVVTGAALLPPVDAVSEHTRRFLGSPPRGTPMPLWGIGLWAAGLVTASLALIRRTPMVR